MTDFFEDVPGDTDPLEPMVVFVPPSGSVHVGFDPPLRGDGVTFTGAWIYQAAPAVDSGEPWMNG